MSYTNIVAKLEKYSFSTRLVGCGSHSKDLMDMHGIIPTNDMVKLMFPWELEIIAALSIVLKDGDNTDDMCFESDLVDCINYIREYVPPKLEQASQNNDFVMPFMIVTGLSQFGIQDSHYKKYHRYNYYFSYSDGNIDMSRLIFDKFGVDYRCLTEFGIIYNSLCVFSKRHNVGIMPKDLQNALGILFREYINVVNVLQISREDFIKLQSQEMSSIEDIHYCFKYLYNFPIIEFDDLLYLPTPHLIVDSVTSGIMHRLTEGDDELRRYVGKNIFESYLYSISEYDKSILERKKEFSYKYRKNLRDTVDLMIRYNDGAILLDSKSFEPRKAIRNISEKEILYALKRHVKDVVQIYKHLRNRFQVEYHPFGKDLLFEPEDVFGIVIVQQDAFLRRKHIFDEAIKVLELDASEHDYMYSNISIMSIDRLESIFFNSQNLMSLLKESRDNPNKWFDFDVSTVNENGKNVVWQETESNAVNILKSFNKLLKGEID